MHSILLTDIINFFQLIVHNRGDCCRERLNNFMVTVGFDKHGNNSEVCGKRELMGNTNLTRIPCSKQIIGQFVQLSIPGPQFLSVCEVQVFGKKGKTTLSVRISILTPAVVVVVVV